MFIYWMEQNLIENWINYYRLNDHTKNLIDNIKNK